MSADAIVTTRPAAILPAQAEAELRQAEALYLEGLGPTGRKAQASKLRTAARIMGGPFWYTDPGRVAGWHSAAEAAGLSIATANAAASAVRGVVEAAWRLGTLDGDAKARVLASPGLKARKVGDPTAGRHLKAGELAALFGAAHGDKIAARGARDAALLALLYGAGLRVSEACALAWADVDLDAEALTVKRGKGGKARRVELAAGVADVLAAWAEYGSDPHVLAAVDKGGNVKAGRLSSRAAQGIASRLAKAARVADFTPHDLRRTYAGDLLDRGADLSTVQRLMGHSSPTTTARYDRRPAETLRRAAQALTVPSR